MKPLLIKDEGEPYMVHFKVCHFNKNPNKIKFYAYPCVNHSFHEGVSYMSNGDSIDFLEEFNKETCLLHFQGSLQLRGGEIESRIYFTDDEYWGGSLEDMARVYREIEKHCEPLLKKL